MCAEGWTYRACHAELCGALICPSRGRRVLRGAFTPLPPDRRAHPSGKDALVRRPARLDREEEGSSLVEMSVSLPIMLVLAMGMLTFGLALNNYLQLTMAVGNAVRQVAISQSLSSSDPCATGWSAISGTRLTSANIAVTYTFLSSTGSSLASYPFSAGATNTCTAAGNTTTGYMNVGNSITVTATYPCDLTVYGVNYAPGCQLSASLTEAIQ
jgi:Flp pilus assembly protein TadG